MIRIANIDDTNSIYELNEELFIVLNELNNKIYNPIAFSKVFIQSMINSNNSDYILLEEDDKVIGYTLIEQRCSPYKEFDSFVEDNYAFIYEFIVLPEYRSKGYGRQIMEEAYKWAKSRKLDSIELNVLENNYSARAFYERNGFEDYQIKLRKYI